MTWPLEDEIPQLRLGDLRSRGVVGNPLDRKAVEIPNSQSVSDEPGEMGKKNHKTPIVKTEGV